MLISALLLAIMVVTISLMLNNVIYSADLSYVGFMDQSRYDNLGFKQTTTNEAIYADMYETNYTTYFTDYVKSLNNITSVKGRYVEVDSNRVNTNTPLPYTNTETTMSIYGKSSKISFRIYTGHSVATPTATATATPTVTPTPHYSINLAPPTGYVICDGVQRFPMVATVTNNGIEVPDIVVQFSGIRDGSDIIEANGTSVGGGAATDSNGKAVVYYKDGNNTPGIVHITANLMIDTSVKSNTIDITCAPVCNDHITVTSINPSNNGKITVKLNLGTFSGETIKSITYNNPDGHAPLASGINLEYKSGPNNIEYKIDLDTTNPTYSATITYVFDAYCSTHKSMYYAKTGTITFHGDQNTLTIDSCTYT